MLGVTPSRPVNPPDNWVSGSPKLASPPPPWAGLSEIQVEPPATLPIQPSRRERAGKKDGLTDLFAEYGTRNRKCVLPIVQQDARDDQQVYWESTKGGSFCGRFGFKAEGLWFLGEWSMVATTVAKVKSGSPEFHMPNTGREAEKAHVTYDMVR
ncbi:hypothetical protein EJ06DRAFT_278930 [Trichodelitschia bisporula]|uniref:Uncharacterized protein n=1 Tax=Trichodelitschia bisporula TaxID=703511 RepID=A0A6G1I5W7_9PEZI|nr:hypothetical protein EJ06DRAFT_278930 [Trichodelitschia bisporula]